MSTNTKARAFVGVQLALLAALVVWPRGEAWRTPVTVFVMAGALLLAGLVILVMSGKQLGSALTPSPVPRAEGSLRTDGLYGLVRHPIYSALLLIGSGLALASRSWVHVVLLVGLAVVLNLKARWEERLLRDRYPTYTAYADRTNRFVPKVHRRPTGG
jgi:protein-S-isoprenylcysteine O-methyltransferase Ste14